MAVELSGSNMIYLFISPTQIFHNSFIASSVFNRLKVTKMICNLTARDILDS